MCVTYTIFYTCGCGQGATGSSNGCDGRCPQEHITYDERLDTHVDFRCLEHALPTPPTSSDTSASESSGE